MSTKKVLIMATTCWPSAARLAGGFAKLGWLVAALAPATAPVRASRFVETVHSGSAFSPLRALSQAIAVSRPDLVVPCDDRAVCQLLALHAQCMRTGDIATAELIARSLGAPQNYPRLMSRAGLVAAAEAAGVAVPRTRHLSGEEDLDRALSAIGLPAVLKADGSWGGGGVVIVRSREEAFAAFRRMARPMAPLRALLRSLRRGDAHYFVESLGAAAPVLSLQQFVPGTPATTSFAAWQGDVLAAIHLDADVTQGMTGPASVVRRIDDAAMAEAVRKLARAFGLSGLHGADFIRDAAGRVHLLEINPRATQTAALALGEGADLLAALAARASGAMVQARPAITLAARIALFPQRWANDPASAACAGVYHDMPWDDPDVLQHCRAELRGRAPVWPRLARLGRALPAPIPGEELARGHTG